MKKQSQANSAFANKRGKCDLIYWPRPEAPTQPMPGALSPETREITLFICSVVSALGEWGELILGKNGAASLELAV